MNKLKWERDYSAEEMQEKGCGEQWWKATWFLIFCQVFSDHGQWEFRIHGSRSIKSSKMFGTKEDAFDAVEARIAAAIKNSNALTQD